MSRRFLIMALAVLASFARVGSMAAQQLGTPDEAKAMLDRAIVALKSDEPGALSQFNDPSDQQFHDPTCTSFALMSPMAKSQPIQIPGCAELISAP
jgi:hypothetical protein